MNYIKKKFLILILMGAALPIQAQENTNTYYGVAIQENPHMVESIDDKAFMGFEIDLWNEIANRTGIDFAFEKKDSFDSVLSAIRNGEASFGLASITISRDKANQMSFSQPYFTTGVTALAYNKNLTALAAIKTIFSVLVVKTIGIYLLFCLLFGFIFWRMERTLKGDIHKTFIPGIFDGLWCAFKKPWNVHSWKARLLNVPWWVITILFSSLITAQVIANFNSTKAFEAHNQLENLNHVHLGVISGSRSEKSIEPIKLEFASIKKASNYTELYKDFKNKKTTAILASEPTINYIKTLAEKDRLDVVRLPELFTEDYYGIAINYDIGWRIVRDIDRAIMELRDNGFIKRLQEKWDIN